MPEIIPEKSTPSIDTQCPIKLDNFSLQTIRFARRNVHEAVVMTYLMEIAKNAENVKVIVVSPQFSDQFKDCSGSATPKLEAKKGCSNTNAYEFIYYNRDDFEIALIPIHTHKPDHWSLGILDRRYNNTLRFYELSQKLTPWQDALLTHSVSTLSPTEKFEPIWVKPEVTNGLKKYTWDAHYNTGVYICVTAKRYVENNGPFVEEILDLDKERSKMFEFLKDLVPEDVKDRKSLGRQSSNGSGENLKKQEIKQEVNEASHKALRTIETCDLPTSQPKLPEIPIELEIKSELDEHQVFEVDKVLDYRVGIDDKRYFLVSWKGFPETENSWEPEDNILFDAQNFLKTIGIPSGEPNGLKTPMTARKRPGKRRTSTRFTHKKRRVKSMNPVLINQHVDNNTTSQDTSQETLDTPQETSKNGDSAQAPSNEASQNVAQVPSNEASQDVAPVPSNGEAKLQENPTQELSINSEYGLVEHPAKLISHHLIKADGHPYIFRITDRRKATKLLCACQTCLTIQQRASLQRKRSGSGITYTIGTLIFQPHRDMLLGDPACPRGTPHCCGEKISDSLKTQDYTEPSSIPSIPAPSIEPPSTKNSSDEHDLEDAPHENVINFTSLPNKKPFPRSSTSTMVGQAPFARPSTSKSPFLRSRLSNANEAAVQKKSTPPQNHKVVKIQNTLASNMNRDDETSIFKPIFISSNLVKVEGYPYTFFVKSKSERPILRCQDCQEIVEKAKQTSQLIPAVGHIILDKKEGLVGDPTKPSNIPHICKFKQAIRPKKIIKRRKRKSAAWKYADQLEAGFIKCKLCGMVRQSFGGTSVIIQHLKNDHYELYLKEYGGSAQEGSAEKSKLVEELVSQGPQNSQNPQKSPETEKSTVIKPISLKIKRISTNDNSLSVSYESELPNETVETALANSELINPENEATQQSDMSDELGCAQVHITDSSINQQICINKPKPATRMNVNGNNNAQQENGQDDNEPQDTYQAEILHIETVKKNIQSIINSRPASTYQGQQLQPISSKQSTHSSTTQPQEPILDFTPVNSIGSFERQALEEIAAANTSSQSPHPSTSTTSEINEEQQWPSIPGRRSPIDIKPRFLINIPSRSYSSSYSNSPGLSPAPSSRPFENMKPKKISNFSTIRIVNARSHFTKNVDVEDCPYKFGYPHADALAPIVQATDPEKYSNEEIDRIKYEVSEQLTKIRDENVDVTPNKRKSKLLLTDSLMVGLNENSIKNCYVVNAQFPFLPSWFLKVLYKQRKLLNFFTSNIDTVFYGLGYDFLRCYKKEKTSLTVNSIIRDLDEFIGALLVPEEDQELTNVKTIAFITIPEVGILQDTLSNFNEGMRQAISKLHQTYQKTVNVQLLDWAKLVEDAENNRMLEESSSFDDRLKLLLGEMEQGYGIEFESS